MFTNRSLASNDFDEKLNGLVQLIEKYRKENNMTPHAIIECLVIIIKHVIEKNIKIAIATPGYSGEVLYANKRIKEEMNKLIYKIDSKKNVLKSLAKEYGRHGKQNR
jgi:hypothetical protein